MCKELDSIKFCSCSENLDLNKSTKNSNYVWILDRVIAEDTSGDMGMTMLPCKKLDALTPQFIVKELNNKNLFDFDYEPRENDQLRIERIDRSKTRRDEYLFGEYLDFNYYKGEWHIGSVSPFSYFLENYKKGKIELGKTSISKE